MEFDMEPENLELILLKMKERNERDMDSYQKQQLLKETSDMLKNDLVSQLISSIKKNVDVFFADRAPTDPQPEVDLSVLRKQAEILFFIFSKSQINKRESIALLDLIRHVSTLVVPEDIEESEEKAKWKSPAYGVVVILQLAHVCALQQTSYLFSRDVDYSDMRSVDHLDVGNSLENESESRHGMDTDFWSCAGAKGFACLVLAVFRQPEVDCDRAPPADVEWFLFEACRMRAYSYIRLCMIPVLQISFLQNKEISSMYMNTLCGLMENLSKIYCFSHYHQAGVDLDFPHVFFPPTIDFYVTNRAHYKARADAGRPGLVIKSNTGVGGAGGESGAAAATGNGIYGNRQWATEGKKRQDILLTVLPSVVDTLDDVLKLYCAILDMQPSFAEKFMSHTDEIRAHAMARHTGGIDRVQAHPFVVKAIEASFKDEILVVSVLKLIASLSHAPLGATAYSVYLLMRDSRHVQLRWGRFFDTVDQVAVFQGAVVVGGNNGGNGGDISGANTGAMNIQQQQQQQSRILSDLTASDIQGLEAIMKLIAGVCSDAHTAQLIVDQYRPSPRLFLLLTRALPVTLKGEIFKALAAIARCSALNAVEIWQLVHQYRLLPQALGTAAVPAAVKALGAASTFRLPSSAATAGGGLVMQQQLQLQPGQLTVWPGGVRAELREAESTSGCYALTDGFLQLIDALLSHGPIEVLKSRAAAQSMENMGAAAVAATSAGGGSATSTSPMRSTFPSTPGAHSSFYASAGAGGYGGGGFGYGTTGADVSSAGGINSGSGASTFRYDGADIAAPLVLSSIVNYLVQDVLLEAQNREYAPAQWPTGVAQAWRLSARALKLLAVILQQYPVNRVDAAALRKFDDNMRKREQEKQRQQFDSSFATNSAGAHGTASTFTETDTNDVTVNDCISDFREDLWYTVETVGNDGVASKTECLRPKSAGFVVMTALLSHNRLIEWIVGLLTDCSANSMGYVFTEYCENELESAVEILCGVREQNRRAAAAESQRMAQRQQLFEQEQLLFQQHHPHVRNPNAFLQAFNQRYPEEDELEEADGTGTDEGSWPVLSALGGETAVCDPVFWREKTISACIGLLYECSLRYERFMSLCDNAPQQLMYVSAANGAAYGKNASLPVNCREFAEVLAAAGALRPLAWLVSFTPRCYSCLPSVNVMSVRLLEKVCVRLSPLRLMSALRPATAAHQQQQRQQYSDDDDREDQSEALVRGCVDAILRGGYHTCEGHQLPAGQLHYDIVALGGDLGPYLFTASKAMANSMQGIGAINTSGIAEFVASADMYSTLPTSGASPATPSTADRFHATLVRAPVGTSVGASLTAGGSDGDIHSYIGGQTFAYGSIREAVVNLLLHALHPTELCLSHKLLGLLSADRGGRSSDNDSNDGDKMTCLDAVLELTSPQNFPADKTFIQSYPRVAVSCFELIYRLCESPLTSEVTMDRLREDYVNFLPAQLSVVLYLFHLSDEELLFVDAVDADSDTAERQEAMVAEIKSSLYHCTAWLLRICSLELRMQDLSSLNNRRLGGGAGHRGGSSVLHTKAKEVASMLFSSCVNLPFDKTDNIMAAHKILEEVSFGVNVAAGVEASREIATLASVAASDATASFTASVRRAAASARSLSAAASAAAAASVGAQREVTLTSIASESMRRATVLQRVARAGESFSETENAFRARDRRGELLCPEAFAYELVDLSALAAILGEKVTHVDDDNSSSSSDRDRSDMNAAENNALGAGVVGSVSRAEFAGIMRSAALINIFNVRAAACNHVCFALRQFIDLCLLGCGRAASMGCPATIGTDNVSAILQQGLKSESNGTGAAASSVQALNSTQAGSGGGGGGGPAGGQRNYSAAANVAAFSFDLLARRPQLLFSAGNDDTSSANNTASYNNSSFMASSIAATPLHMSALVHTSQQEQSPPPVNGQHLWDWSQTLFEDLLMPALERLVECDAAANHTSPLSAAAAAAASSGGSSLSSALVHYAGQAAGGTRGAAAAAAAAGGVVAYMSASAAEQTARIVLSAVTVLMGVCRGGAAWTVGAPGSSAAAAAQQQIYMVLLPEQHAVILSALVKLLSRRGRIGSSLQPLHHSNAEALALYRRHIAVAYSIVLQSVENAMSSVSLGGVSGSSSNNSSADDAVSGERKSTAEDSAGGQNALAVLSPAVAREKELQQRLAEYQSINVDVLEKRVGDLIEQLALDASSGTSASSSSSPSDALVDSHSVGKLTALTAISNTLSALGPVAGAADNRSSSSGHGGSVGPSYKHYYGSHAFVQAVQVMLNKNYLTRFLRMAIGEAPSAAVLNHVGQQQFHASGIYSNNSNNNSNSNSSGVASASASACSNSIEDSDVKQFCAVISLCTHVAVSLEGVLALTYGTGGDGCGTAGNGAGAQLLERLDGLHCFRNPPPLPEELLGFGEQAVVERNIAVGVMLHKFLPVVRLLQSMLASSPSVPVARGAAKFIMTNHVLVSQLLRIRYLSLTGLELTSALTSLISMIAAVRRPANDATAVGICNGWFGASMGAAMLSEMCGLLQVMGSCPIAPQLAAAIDLSLAQQQQQQRSAVGSGSGASFNVPGAAWWSKITPSTESEFQMHRPASMHQGQQQQQHSSAYYGGGRATVDVTAPLSTFDVRKMELALRIVSTVSAFVRLTVSEAVETSDAAAHGSKSDNGATSVAMGAAATIPMQSLDLPVVSQSFRRCAVFASAMQSRLLGSSSSTGGAEGAGDSSSSLTWLQSSTAAFSVHHNTPLRKVSAAGGTYNGNMSSSSNGGEGVVLCGLGRGDLEAVRNRLLFVCENLICVTHDAVLGASPREKRDQVAATRRRRAAATAAAAAAGGASSVAATEEGIDSVIDTATRCFPAHSLVGQVSRWMKDSTVYDAETY